MAGVKAEDTVCLTPDKCASQVRFLNALQTTGLSGLKADGILGLSPSDQGSGADMLLDELQQKGLLETRTFSFQIGDGNELSYVTMGGYDAEKYARGPLVWHDLVDDNYWTLS